MKIKNINIYQVENEEELLSILDKIMKETGGKVFIILDNKRINLDLFEKSNLASLKFTVSNLDRYTNGKALTIYPNN